MTTINTQGVCTAFTSQRIVTATGAEAVPACCTELSAIPEIDTKLLKIYLAFSNLLDAYDSALEDIPDRGGISQIANREGIYNAIQQLNATGGDTALIQRLNRILDDYDRILASIQAIGVTTLERTANTDGSWEAMQYIVTSDGVRLSSPANLSQKTLSQIRAIMQDNGNKLTDAIFSLITSNQEAVGKTGICAPATVATHTLTVIRIPTINGNPVFNPTGILRPGQHYTVTINGTGLGIAMASIKVAGTWNPLTETNSSTTTATFEGNAPDNPDTYTIEFYYSDASGHAQEIRSSSIKVANSFFARVPWRVGVGIGGAWDRTPDDPDDPDDSVLALREGVTSFGRIGADLLNLGETDLTTDPKIMRSDTLTLSLAWKGYSPNQFFQFNPWQLTGNLDWARRINPSLGFDLGFGIGGTTAYRTIKTTTTSPGNYPTDPTLANSSNANLNQNTQSGTTTDPTSTITSINTDNATWAGVPLRLHVSLVNIFGQNSFGEKTNIAFSPVSLTWTPLLFTDQESRRSLSTLDWNPEFDFLIGTNRAWKLGFIGDFSGNFRPNDGSRLFDSIGFHIAIGWRNPVPPQPYKDK